MTIKSELEYWKQTAILLRDRLVNRPDLQTVTKSRAKKEFQECKEVGQYQSYVMKWRSLEAT